MSNKGGRPTKYRTEFCDMLVVHMQAGLSFESFGGVIGVSEDTLHKWKNRYKKFSESYKTGLSYSRIVWERMGIDMASGKASGNSATWIFNMKNRFGWKDKHEVDHTSKGEKIVGFNYVPPAPVGDEGNHPDNHADS